MPRSPLRPMPAGWSSSRTLRTGIRSTGQQLEQLIEACQGRREVPTDLIDRVGGSGWLTLSCGWIAGRRGRSRRSGHGGIPFGGRVGLGPLGQERRLGDHVRETFLAVPAIRDPRYSHGGRDQKGPTSGKNRRMAATTSPASSHASRASCSVNSGVSMSAYSASLRCLRSCANPRTRCWVLGPSWCSIASWTAIWPPAVVARSPCLARTAVMESRAAS